MPADGFFQSIRRGHGEHFAVGTEFLQLCGAFAWGKSTEKSVAIAAAGFITLMAFVFNTCVAGIPTPLSDTGIFMNSLCGMWVLVAVVQGISLLIQAVLQPTVEQETGASETNVWNRLQKVAGVSFLEE